MRLKIHKPTAIVNKGSRQAMLPSRAAVRQLTKGDPTQQSLGNYAKLTPSGAGAPGNYPSTIASEGQMTPVSPAIPDDGQ
jgi:hypothetical protein